MNTTAVAYYRTSSATNVGADKDSQPRQQAACSACATARGLVIVREFYDAAVSGADPVDTRPGFSAMLEYLLGNGARTIVVENASRFARDLIVQETGYQMLKARGIELIAADSPDSFLSDTPTAAMVRQILGAVAQFEKTALVQKLRKARDRRSAQLGRRCEGNPAWIPVTADVRSIAHDLRRDGLNLSAISRELAARGMRAASGRAYSASSVKAMLKRPL
jgi:DNA invertase Pin-like site-specific DNA recombinase